MSLFKYFSILVVLLFIQINLFSQTLIIDRITNTQSFQDTINQFWHKFKPYVENSIEKSDINTYNLYKVQITTNRLLKYAFEGEKYALVDDLLEVYMGALTTLDTLDRYKFAYFYLNEELVDTILLLDKTYLMWINGIDKTNPAREDILSISQFLALVSDAIFNIAIIPSEYRTATMKQFVSLYSSVLDSHYQRWVFGISVYNTENSEEFLNVGPFQRRGWGCKYKNAYIPSHLTHMQLIDFLLEKKCGDNNSKKYCNCVTDTDLWIIAGVSSFVAAHLVDSVLVGSVSNLHFYKNNYLPVANDLIISRISTTNIINFQDSLVWGADFDNGILDNYPDNRFSGYDNPYVYPTLNDVSWSEDIGWDISHGRRFVNVFQTLYDTRTILGFDFPNSNIMAMFANQYAYVIFNRDFEQPLFSNYFDGANGWYRVGYSNRLNFGYGPFDLSIASLTGGFSCWNIYNSDVRIISNSLYCLIHSDDTIKKNFLNQHYEKTRWNNDSATNLPKREQLHNFENGLSQEPDSATLSVLLSFYSSIGITSNEKEIETKITDDVIIFPNPVNDKIFIMSENKINEIFIIDAKGSLVYSQKYSNSYVSINIHDLIKGTYIVKIKNENNEIFSKKIVIV